MCVLGTCVDVSIEIKESRRRSRSEGEVSTLVLCKESAGNWSVLRAAGNTGPGIVDVEEL